MAERKFEAEKNHHHNRAVCAAVLDSNTENANTRVPMTNPINYEHLVDAIPQLVWVTDVDGTLNFCNARFKQLNESLLSPAQGVRQWDAIVHPDDRAATMRTWQQALKTGQTFCITHRLMGPDEHSRWYLSRAIPVRDPGGSISGWYGTSTDIDVEKRAQAVVSESQERYRTFATVAFEGIVISVDGHIIDCNQQYARMLGCEPPEIIGLMLVDLHPEEEHRRVIENIRRGTEAVTEYCMLCKDGSRITVEAHGRTVHKNGQMMRLSVVRDISGRKHYEQMLKDAHVELEDKIRERTAELEQRNQELKELSHKIIEAMENDRKALAQELHDSIGGTLSAIMYQLEARVCGMGQPPPCEDMSFEKMIDHLVATISETRRISKRLRPHILDDFGLVAAIRDHINDFNEFFPHIKIVQRVRILENTITDDIKMVLYRVIQEAFTNAGKHSRADTVKINLFKKNSAVHLHIQDNGDGFDVATHFKASTPLSGYGLRNMKQRVELCRGRFDIESRPNKGTSLKVSIPLV